MDDDEIIESVKGECQNASPKDNARNKWVVYINI